MSVNAEFFMSHGVDRATAESFVAEHRALSGGLVVDGPPSVPLAPGRIADALAPRQWDQAQAMDATALAAHFRSLGADADTATRMAHEHQQMTGSAPMPELTEAQAAAQPLPTDAEFQRLYDRSMTAPHSLTEYDFGPSGVTDEARAIDTEFKTAARDMGLPPHIANTIADAVQRTAADLQNPEPVRLTAHMQIVTAKLQTAWGEAYQTRLDAVNDFIAAQASKHDIIGKLFDANPYLFTNTDVFENLWRFIEHRNRSAK